ncbi:hypothetical protein QBC38DRAFT_488307 [Podospora fimiseda]|uniref:Uncharacterized protein n=1 Tax=Podospora fimiseda TaxID=252190 RepID=A0AAN7BGZ8_9PEZI|nr:hypothetical protein QBC38DRAFT_488307 [Podospora fimiseda]
MIHKSAMWAQPASFGRDRFRFLVAIFGVFSCLLDIGSANKLVLPLSKENSLLALSAALVGGVTDFVSSFFFVPAVAGLIVMVFFGNILDDWFQSAS